MTQAMNHYQKQECCCFMCRDTGHFTRDCPHREAFRVWPQGTFKLPGGGPEYQDTHPKEQPIELATRVIPYQEVAPALETGPTMRWVGLEMLVDMILDGCESFSTG